MKTLRFTISLLMALAASHGFAVGGVGGGDGPPGAVVEELQAFLEASMADSIWEHVDGGTVWSVAIPANYVLLKDQKLFQIDAVEDQFRPDGLTLDIDWINRNVIHRMPAEAFSELFKMKMNESRFIPIEALPLDKPLYLIIPERLDSP